MKSGRESDNRPTRAAGGRILRATAMATLAAAFVLAGSLWTAPVVLAQSGQTAAQPTQQQRAAQRKKKPAALAASRPASASASSQTPPKREPKGFIETIMEGPRLTTTPPEAADWVRQTRRDPNSARAAPSGGPSRPLLTPDQIRAREAALDSARARHDRIAGRRSPTGKVGSAAGKPEPPKPEEVKPGCVLTCATSIGVPRTQRR